MAEFILKDMVEKRGIADKFYIASAATSTEEIWNGVGNPVYPMAKAELAKHGIGCAGKRAIQVTKEDYHRYDYLICMDSNNLRSLQDIVGLDVDNKISLLLQHAGINRDISDPWYTRRFSDTYRDIVMGLEGFLNNLKMQEV